MSRPLRGVLLAGVVVAVLAGGFFVARSSRQSSLLAPLPKISLEQFQPTARKLVSEMIDNVKKEPLRADRWGELGYALAGNEAFNEAGACFARAEELDPDNFRWPHLFAFSTIKASRGPAIAALKRAMQINPNIVPTMSLLAEAYLDDGAVKEADALLRPRITEKTEDQRLLFEMARVEANAGAVDHAIKLAEQAAAAPPRRAQIHQLLVQLYQRKGNAVDAKKHARILEILPASEANAAWPDSIAVQALRYSRDVDTMAIQARQLVSSGQADEAVRMLERMDPVDRSSSIVASVLAIAKAQLGEFKEAEKVLTAVPAKDDPNVAFAEGIVASLQEKYAEAVKHYAKVAGSTSNTNRSRFADGALVNQGQCYLALKKEEEAMAAFEQALKLNPGNIEAIERLAALYLKKGRKADAARILNDAALLEPTDETIKELQKLAAG